MAEHEDNGFEMASVRAIRSGKQSRRGARGYRTVDSSLTDGGADNSTGTKA